MPILKSLIYEYRGRTQILLLHLPDDNRWKLFKNVKISLEDQIIADSRKQFENKSVQDPVPAINEKKYSEAYHLLRFDLIGSSEEDDEIAGSIMKAAAHGCWKGYGEWKTTIQDSDGECYVYFYFSYDFDDNTAEIRYASNGVYKISLERMK